MRITSSIFSVVIALASPVYAYTVDEMWAEFDATKLSLDEKRFLQFGLALEGQYSALVDGAWGNGSQAALEAWARGAGLQPPIESWEVVLLAADTAEALRVDGWEQRYFEPMDMSFAVPAGRMKQEQASEFFLNYAHDASTLRYSLNLGDLPNMQGFHTYALRSALPGSSPYTLRREKVLITSVDQPAGTILYVRSDLRRNGWATVMLSAAKRDQHLLSAVSGSITKGWSNAIDLPPSGEIMEGFTSMATILVEADEQQTADEYASLEAMRQGMTAPPTVPHLPSPPVDQQAVAPAAPSAPKPAELTLQGTGTAFFVSEQGHLITNAHVVEGCELLKIDGRDIILIAVDENFDLALIKDIPQRIPAVAKFASRPAALNADITIAGYPLTGILSGLNITRGSVSSLKGPAGDPIRMQISAPVQPGNSGGPAVDATGHVVGVVVSKLDAKLIAETIGDIPQNVNFAVRGEMAKLFLFQNNVEPILGADDEPLLDAVTLGKDLERTTRLVECYGHSN
ncbi:S1 family peptidase [Paracoccus litorisediminis]|uniref:Trypsin-like peptidase domain-containing protein n=1 Tax=Paracoccus litorisediminis TaxID=2006130 RepID=A0A844HJG5_9RHOB|nr:serine protease [Paracoccus litorisediminis]MTH57872.1 hypothetical protein [Paracoccus litorisediminis]